MLVIEIEYPAGRYYAASSEAPATPEWPPHPARLYSALMAAACTGRDEPTHTARAALEWLENQAPPLIQAGEADLGDAPTNYVPPADHNTQSNVEHPMHRARKPREFPVAYLLGDPVVRYAWATEPPSDVVDTLDELCASITHVGTSHSMALARAYVDELTAISHEPGAEADDFVRIVLPGRFEELQNLHDRQQPNVRRPPSACEAFCGYRSRSAREAALPGPFAEMHILRIRQITHTTESTLAVARAVRDAVVSSLDRAVAAAEGTEDGPHVGWLPLPDAGHEHALGRIMGLGIALPRGMSEDHRLAVLRATGHVSDVGFLLPDGRTVALEPLAPDLRPPAALHHARWTRPAYVWETVTPVVPDRLPKRRRPEDYAASVADSLIRAGYPEPVDVTTSPHSALQGGASIHRYELSQPRFHARVRFPSAVEGPVVAGRLRYFGIGLLAPTAGGRI